MPHQCTGCGHAFEDGSKEMLGGCPDCGGNKFQFYPEGTELPEQPPGDAEAPQPPEPEGSAVASKVGRATTKVRDFVSTNAPDDEPAGDPDPDAPWPDSSDAADPIRKGGLGSDGAAAPSSDEHPLVSGGESGDGDIIDADARETERALEDAEDVAQADARARVASEAEVDAATENEAPAEPDAPDDAGASLTPDDAPDSGMTADAAGEVTDTPDDAAGEVADAPDAADAAPGEAAATPPEADGQVVRAPTGEEPDLAELREQLNDQFESIKILEPGQYELNLMELYDRDEYIIALQENGRYVIQVPENFMGDRPDE